MSSRNGIEPSFQGVCNARGRCELVHNGPFFIAIETMSVPGSTYHYAVTEKSKVDFRFY